MLTTRIFIIIIEFWYKNEAQLRKIKSEFESMLLAGMH